MREYYYFPCIDLPVNPKGWFALFFGGDTEIAVFFQKELAYLKQHGFIVNVKDAVHKRVQFDYSALIFVII